jgi:copper transport protein
VRRRLVLDAAFAALIGTALVVSWALYGDAVASGTALSLARAVRLLAVGASTGLLVLAVAVWAPLRRSGALDPRADDAFAGIASWALRRIAIIGAASALLILVLQTSYLGPIAVGDAAAPDRWSEALRSRSGAWLGLSAAAFAAIAVTGPTVVRTRTTWAGPVAGASLLVLVVAPALGGTPVPSVVGGYVVPPFDLLHGAFETVHVAAMGAWIGGLLALLLGMPAALRALPDDRDRTRLTAAVLLRFSPVALTAVTLLTLAGTALALLSLTTLYDFVDTAYGRAVFVKIVLLLLAIVIAVAQREYLVPRLERAAEPDSTVDPGRARKDVRTAMLGEALLLTAVLIVTGALAGYAPPKTLADAPATVTRDVGDQRWSLTVEPARSGTTSVTLSVLRSNGAWIARNHDVRMRAVPPGRVGSADRPADVELQSLDAGQWTADDVQLGARGTWRFEIELRSPSGAHRNATLPVRIR